MSEIQLQNVRAKVLEFVFVHVWLKYFGNSCKHQSRRLVAKSEDALSNPYLIFENVARVKRLVDSVGFTGGIAVGDDCTKVCKHLSFSTDFGSHILGSVLPLEQCEVQESEDIDAVIADIKKKKAIATQTRAIIAQVSISVTLT
jgi:hypothetical protein